jgi:hypothetical protein
MNRKEFLLSLGGGQGAGDSATAFPESARCAVTLERHLAEADRPAVLGNGGGAAQKLGGCLRQFMGKLAKGEEITGKRPQCHVPHRESAGWLTLQQ